MTDDETDAFILRQITEGVSSARTRMTYEREACVSPQYLATMLSLETRIPGHPSPEVQASLARLLARGDVVSVTGEGGLHGYMGIGLVRPTVRRSPRALQLGA